MTRQANGRRTDKTKSTARSDVRSIRVGGNDSIHTHFKCPFYHRITGGGRLLVCEGESEHMESCIMFRCMDDLKKYMVKRCSTFQYGLCPLAAARIAAFNDDGSGT